MVWRNNGKRMEAKQVFVCFLVLIWVLLPWCACLTHTPKQAPGKLRVEHRFEEAGGVRWHYVEAGSGEPVVFLHGLPESWYSWHYQIEEVSKKFRVIAVDLKGYGQSDKSDGDYSAQGVASELIALFDDIGLERFSLVTHDWGSVIGDHIASMIPERIIKYVRMQAPLLKIEPANHPQFLLFKDQDLAVSIMSQAQVFVTKVYESRTVQKISDEDMERIIFEFSRPGVAEAIPRYFRDFSMESEVVKRERFRKMSFPVLVLQGENDPAQPLWYFEDIDEVFPNVEFQIIRDAGHFTQLEKPEEVTGTILDFLRH